MRINFIMPDDLVKDIDRYAVKLGISRSAYIVMTMSQKIQSEEMISKLPELQGLMATMQDKLSKMKIEDEKTED